MVKLKDNFLQAETIHFTGIKGVGMTALVLVSQDLGKIVEGSDVADKFVTDEILNKRKIPLTVGFSAGHIREGIDLVIYTGAHSGPLNTEVIEAKRRGIAVMSHAEALGIVMGQKSGISVCGVGGKTTTAAMIATILTEAKLYPSFAVGVGNIFNLGVPGKFDKGRYFIAEADEYVVSPGVDNRPRFLFQRPEIIVLTNIKHDHPDVYPTLTDTKRVFGGFLNKLPRDGGLVVNGDDSVALSLIPKGRRIIRYGKGVRNEMRLVRVEMEKGKQIVEMEFEKKRFQFRLTVCGEYNARNGLAAAAAGMLSGISMEEALAGLEAFTGTKRRFEKVGEVGGTIFYDDYAHHPSEIVAVLAAARLWWPQKRLIAVFQPHTFSRTKALMSEFAQSFNQANQVIITDIYASARERADVTVSGEKLAQATARFHPQVEFVPQSGLVEYLSERVGEGDILLTLGAGDIYKVHEQIFLAKR
ncbi:UDP-N-acetylmuramate--L-alanine ligase [Microgenomates group bacterium RIFCSPLOWO2_01_FULL_46_13]|nr:MAG: UDP-N-acetylmuramate--L-alanine ligase [Microgenomates group bacterium RIFCSPHIGHO2_01_FULL_45_11]OGV94620.1 MAG: UDP-N-acetylmuramate--L-alanine ligase [Microgenomates group bacterium RIFCSPLOWO2_01_FULL_46_13]